MNYFEYCARLGADSEHARFWRERVNIARNLNCIVRTCQEGTDTLSADDCERRISEARAMKEGRRKGSLPSKPASLRGTLVDTESDLVRYTHGRKR